VTLSKCTLAVILAVQASRGSGRPAMDIVVDCLMVARTCDRLGIGLSPEVETFLAGCIRVRAEILNRDAAEDLVRLCIDYYAKRSAELN
jgi:hypothetical protein